MRKEELSILVEGFLKAFFHVSSNLDSLTLAKFYHRNATINASGNEKSRVESIEKVLKDFRGRRISITDLFYEYLEPKYVHIIIRGTAEKQHKTHARLEKFLRIFVLEVSGTQVYVKSDSLRIISSEDRRVSDVPPAGQKTKRVEAAKDVEAPQPKATATVRPSAAPMSYLEKLQAKKRGRK